MSLRQWREVQALLPDLGLTEEHSAFVGLT